MENYNMIREFIYDSFNKESYDGVSFFHEKNDMKLTNFSYAEKSDYKKSNDKFYYHVMLYKINDKLQITECDLFDCILYDPSVYITNLIKCHFFGLVSKKTDYSIIEIEKFYNKIKNCVVKSNEN